MPFSRSIPVLVAFAATVSPMSGAPAPARSTRRLTAEVVEADATSRTLVVRSLAALEGRPRSSSATGAPSAGGSVAVPGTAGSPTSVVLRIEERAARALKDLQPGDRVELACPGPAATAVVDGRAQAKVSPTLPLDDPAGLGSAGSESAPGWTNSPGMSQAAADAYCGTVTSIRKR
jgi:hypothetical protein